MLASVGLWYIHEPFNPNKHYWKESFTYRKTGTNNPDVDRYFRELLDGKHREMSQIANSDSNHWLMPIRVLPQPIQRIMIKDPLACLLTEYLHQKFNLQTLVLFRHPCGFASSIHRLGWPSAGFLKDFLSREDLMNDFLKPHQSLVEKYSVGPDSLESIAVLHGCLNLVLWEISQRNESIEAVLFEDLCRSPIESFKELFIKWKLPYNDDVKTHHESLCMNKEKSVDAYHTHSTARNSQSMAESWRDQFDQQQINRIRKIWEQFEIPIYESDEQW